MNNIQDLAKYAIEVLSSELSNAGCNDLYVKNTPEMRALHDEAEAWNLGVPVENVQSHPDYWDRFTGKAEGADVVVNDYILIYALKKLTGTL